MEICTGGLSYKEKTRHPLSAKSENLIFNPLEVVSRHRNPQLHMSKNYIYTILIKTYAIILLFFLHKKAKNGYSPD